MTTKAVHTGVEVSERYVATNEPLHTVVRGPYTFGSREPLREEIANRLVQLLSQGSDSSPRTVLGGRSDRWKEDIEGLGAVYIKRYAHGGALKRLTSSRFLAIGECRSQQEFEMLEQVRTLGIAAPRPLVYVKRGVILYSTWLVMEEIPNTMTLVEVSENSPDLLPELMRKLGDQLITLIKHHVFHVDLHPGNVVVSRGHDVYIVDFDKAYIFKGSSMDLRELYLRRWRRAVIKHGLSPELTEHVSLTLRGVL